MKRLLATFFLLAICTSVTLAGNNDLMVDTFTGLGDTPNSYSGEGGNCAAVNVGETALEFTACGAGGASTALDNLASVQINTSLLSDTADTDSLGTTSAEWLNAYIGDAGKLYFGLGQDGSIHRNAANELTITASSGVTTSAGLTVTGAVTEGGNAVPNSTDNLSFFAATTSAQLAGVLSDETGSGAAVFGTSPTFTTPALGTPSAAVLTNATGLPVSGIADGTDGELITWDASGNAAVVATGTATHVLTSNGAGAAPTFQAAAAGDSVSFVQAGGISTEDANVNHVVNGASGVSLSFTDNQNADAVASFKVPSGKTGISSIVVIYDNEEPSTNLYLQFNTRRNRVGSADAADTTDTFSTYATPANDNYTEDADVPSGAYDGLGALQANDIVQIEVTRNGSDASDTYNADWDVWGVQITWS